MMIKGRLLLQMNKNKPSFRRALIMDQRLEKKLDTKEIISINLKSTLRIGYFRHCVIRIDFVVTKSILIGGYGEELGVL